MSTLYVMVGIPGSGKSTKAKEMSENGIVTFSSDKLRGEFFGDEGIQFTEEWLKENGYNGSDDFNTKKSFALNIIFDQLYQRVQSCLEEGRDAVLDATSPGKVARKKIVDRFGQSADKIVAIVMATPYAVCMKRNLSRDRVVPVEAMEMIAGEFEYPEISEGIDEIICIGNKNDIDYGKGR